MRSLVLIIAAVFTLGAHADNGLVGFWKTIDEKTGKPRGLVEFTETDGVFRGVLRETYKEPRKEKCDVCPGDKKGQPMIGLEIVWDVKAQGKNEWGGGASWIPKAARPTG